MKIVLCIIALIILIVIHALIGYYVDKFKMLKKDKVTNWSLVPFANIFLLGKYVLNFVSGILLFIALIIVSNYTILVDNVRYGITLIDNNVRTILFIVYFIIIVFTLVFANRKYNALTRYKDMFKFERLIYYLKETLWILLFFVIIYAFLVFVIGYSKI